MRERSYLVKARRAPLHHVAGLQSLSRLSRMIRKKPSGQEPCHEEANKDTILEAYAPTMTAEVTSVDAAIGVAIY